MKIKFFFKPTSNKRFHYIPRYYDERKERLEKIKDGKSVRIKFKRDKNLNLSKARIIRLLMVTVSLFFITYLVLYK